MAATIQNIEFPTKPRALDSSGNNNHGKIYSGRALEFDGISDYLSTGYGSGLNPTTADITITAWANQISVAHNDVVIGTPVGTNQRLYLGQNGGFWDIGIQSSPWNNTSTGGVLADRASANVNTWYRLVLILSGTTATLYVNGVETISKTYSSYTLSSGFNIGNNDTDTDNSFSGLISDVQIWDKAWSTDDIAYDYVNPESLALNASGTALTEGNLKVWYPMQDGHRGQQSYILDGANTGLKDEMVSNGDFSNGLTGWTLSGTAASATQELVDGKLSMYSGTASDNSNVMSRTPALNYSGVSGVTYRLKLDVSGFNGTSTKGTIRLNGVNEPSNQIQFSAGENTVYFRAHSDFTYFRFTAESHSDTYTVDNVSLKAINDKHHATTVFYGDELIASDAADNRTFDNDTGNWATYDDSGGDVAISNNSNKLRIVTTTDNEKEGAKLPIAHVGNGTTTSIVAGRTYRISANIDHITGGTGSPFIYVGIGGALATAFQIDTSNAVYTKDIVAANNTGDLLFYTSVGEEVTFEIDNVSVKEVGIATGWTDADQQLDIAQLALQSYNEMAWFDGVTAGKVTCDSGATIDNVFAGGGTFSGWVYPVHSAGASQARRIAEKSKWLVYYHDETSTEAFVSFKHIASTTDSITRTLTKDLKIGKWNHVAATFNKDSIDTAAVVYINGVSVATDLTAGAGTAADDSGDTMFIANNNSGNRGLHGSITEVSLYEEVLTAAEILELYNEGKALDATTHSQVDELKAYWRNNGLSTWTDLSTNSNDGTISGVTETILIPQGVDVSRDAQGFIMNKVRNTSSLNLTNAGRVDGYVDLGSTMSVADDAAASFVVWLKPDDTATDNYFLGTGATDFIKLNSATTIVFAANNNLAVVGSDNFFDVTTNSGPSIAAGEWMHVAITRKSDDTFRLYTNGVLRETSTALNHPFDFRYIGARKDNEYTFRGQLDGFLYYDDQLTDAEVLKNYNATKGVHTN